MGIVRFALRFPRTFYVMALAILFLGISAIFSAPKDIFPVINIPGRQPDLAVHRPCAKGYGGACHHLR